MWLRAFARHGRAAGIWPFRQGRGLIRLTMEAWRRSIQLRVVATTLLLSVAVALFLGMALVDQVRDSLLTMKKQTSTAQAKSGFALAKAALEASGDPGSLASHQALLRVVDQLAVGSGGSAGNAGNQLYDLVLFSLGGANPADPVAPSPASLNGLDPTSISRDLHGVLARQHQVTRASSGQQTSGDNVFRQVITVRYLTPGGEVRKESALAVGTLLDVDGNAYELYYVFPLNQEQLTLESVRNDLATAGIFLCVLLGVIAWLVTRQVVTPVRMAARIAERLAAGRLEERMRVQGEDDLARLASSFNKMATNLQRQIRQLEELSRVQRRFVSDVSHELRTPLTTVRMAADVLYEGREEFDGHVSRAAELLQNQLDRFESLLTDLLEISRFDAGAAVLDAEPIDLREIVQRVVEASEPLAQRRGSEVRVTAPPTPCVAEVDPRRIERIIRNLVVNAVEHGEGQDVLVKVAVGEDSVAVAVRDYGVGLKPGESSLVFNRFWRADPARARTTGGTGLGLSIALEDAHLHGGWLQAWGEPGDGSQFRLTLPRSAGREVERSAIPLEPEDSRRNRSLGSVGTPQRGTAVRNG